MPISITPVIPPQGSAPVTPDPVLQPGTVVEARVLQQLGASLARIALANTVMEVMTETPLVPGTTLRVTVSRNTDGALKLVATPPDEAGDATLSRPAASPDPAAAAVVRAVRQAAPRQAGLSPLFADLSAALAQGQLPPQVRAAAVSLLSQRPALADGVDAAGLQQALQRSGLLHESATAAGRAPSSGMPDLKAALIVLRQVLAQWHGGVAQTPSSGAMPATPASPAALPRAQAVAIAAPPLAPEEFVIPITVANTLPANPQARPHPISLSELLASFEALEESATAAPDAAVRGKPVAGEAHDAGAKLPAQTPSPPFRGAAPSAQPVAQPSLSAEDPATVVVHRLLDEVDGALARQTLLQIASLPDHSGQRTEQPRWSFEIPFATPQGTAVAQFEISRDGANAREADGTRRIWRARFSLDVEPAGPVHAMIALSGERASVRLWADRPETIARLRDGAPLLSHALREAELDPGEIAIGGPPPAAASAATGQFWNRAS